MTATSTTSFNVNEVPCLGYTLYAAHLNDLPLSAKTLISTINQNAYCLGEIDSEFKESMQKSEVLLPDGVGMVLAAKIMSGAKVKKIAGADIHQFLLEKLNTEHGSCFYMGAAQQTLDKISVRLKKEYPNIRFETYSPPYVNEFSKSENEEIIQTVNKFKPDVLFVGMSAPKQEKWAYANKHRLETNTIVSIGAVFDFYAGTVERPSQFLIDHGLEWFGRLVKEPRRMAKRYVYYGFKFLFYVFRAKITSILK